MVSYHHLIFLTFLPLVISDLTTDRAALLLLQSAVRGRTLLWDTSSATPCSWFGVTCNSTTNRVIELRLPGSSLRGELPLNSIGNLTELRVLSLRRNSLSGQLPSDLASCTQLEEIHLQVNNFSGEILESFFTLTNLLQVNLANNSFSGNLPYGFNNLTNLRTLYLENNKFTGSLPDWNGLQLKNFNVSFNGLTGDVPSSLGTFPPQSFLGTILCGGTLISCSNDHNGSKLSGRAIAGIVIGSFVVLLMILIVLFISWKTYRRRKILPRNDRSPMPRSPVGPLEHGSPNPNSTIVTEQYDRSINNHGSDGLVFFGKCVQVFTLDELLTSSAELIGKGIVGSTYKAYLDSGAEVIVKRVKNVSVSEQEFRAKIEEVGSLVHENLEPLRGYFYGRDEKLLLYEPMPKGSLSQLLHGEAGNNKDNSRPTLSWEVRVRIALGTASAIEYLHSVSTVTTHGNIKSSNILLTGYYDARVSEFGLTQLVSSASNLNGYRPPEVMDSRRVSQKADIYSFGVLLLELVTSKEPDRVLTEEGIELPNWVQSVILEKGIIQVFDPHLLVCESAQEAMAQLFHVAVSCTSQNPERRPSMTEVRQRIEEICG